MRTLYMWLHFSCWAMDWRDDGRQLIFRKHAEALAPSGEIWIRKRGFDDHRLAVRQERSGNACR